MSVSAQEALSQSANVVLERQKGGAWRVVAYPLDFCASAGTPTQHLEKHAGVDLKHQHLYQQHFYTGEVIRADSSFNCGSRSNLFTPHGLGTLVWLMYAKRATGCAGKPSTSAGLPHAVVVSEYGEVSELKDAVLFAFCVYKGSFTFGKRQGKGRLSVHPRYTLECAWDDDAPVLGCTPCVLRLLTKPHMASDASSEKGNVLGSTRVRLASGCGVSSAGEDVTNRYLGMISLIFSDERAHQSSFSGLAWAESARFVPNGVGEMLYPHGIRYCGLWQCGLRHGFGVEYDPEKNTVFMGAFLCDHREGPGMLHYCKTDAFLSGNWKEGKLSNAGNAIPPTHRFILQGVQWKSCEDLSFDHGSLVRSRNPPSGVWEPLFVAFDEILASVSGSQHDDSFIVTNVGTTSDDTDDCDAESFLPLFSSMLERPEFASVLATFQRCFYFLYKACIGGGVGSGSCCCCCSSSSSSSSNSKEIVETKNNDDEDERQKWQSNEGEDHAVQGKLKAQFPNCVTPFLLKLRDAGRERRRQSAASLDGLPCCWSCPSWCEELELVGGCPGIECFHTASVVDGLATRMPQKKLFECAMRDLSSFVSSVRLRMLSYMAAHPAACNVTISKKVLAACWDSVYALVSPVIHNLAAAAEVETTIAVSMALQRCMSLGYADFVPTTMTEEFCGRDKNRAVIERCARTFASPASHGRRIVKLTSNGQLLQFGPYVVGGGDGDGDGDGVPAVYTSPAAMFSAFDAMRSQAMSLFPHDALLQERWMGCSVVAAFAHMENVDPRKMLSPSAVLRVLRFLACDVNPRYPFPHAESMDFFVELKMRKYPPSSSRKGNCRGGRPSYSDGGARCWQDSLMPSSSAASALEMVLPSLLAVRDSVERLCSIYPTIRCGVLPPCAADAAAASASPPAATTTTVHVNETSVVYPLDELAVRTRFVLLTAAAAEVIQQRRNQEIAGGCICPEGEGKVFRVTGCNEHEEVVPMAECIQRVLRLPTFVMQQALKDHMCGCFCDFLRLSEKNQVGTNEPRMQLRVPLSEVLLWIIKCIGGVLESPNFPASERSCVLSRRFSKQRRSYDVPSSSSPSMERHVNPAYPTAIGWRRQLPHDCAASTHATSPADKEEVGGDGQGKLLYEWKHFLSNIMPAAAAAATAASAANCNMAAISSETEKDPYNAPAAPCVTTDLLTEDEILQFLLVQSLLADVGLRVNLYERCCYDNEEDALPSSLPSSAQWVVFTAQGKMRSSSDAEPSCAAATTAALVPCCVGKELKLSLQLCPSFFGSRMWEALADAWLSSLVTLRAADFLPQHSKRR